MTTPNLEQIIAAHPYRINAQRVWCACGWDAYPDETPNGMDAHAAHVVAAIRDSGLTVIALPEPTGSDDTGRHEWLNGEVYVGGPGNGRVRCYLEDPRMSDDEAADLGAALIAAAQVAERNNHE
ncbi:hypothetical protein SEA_CLARK_60 [Gordonia phage Clark]|uniref:Uncharacterized protein n=2 Tax=Beenievirus TaxID=3044673 RepID=A0A4Y6EQV0_9CAUD|nr:hypothetical protein PP507_gp60 [Gordonia phage Clark]YP_010654534.1 hypothetical protein PP508_gp61 [Gordonia phage Samman98]QDF18009.1 hypothetical protein SEA_CLARK_60 [Gordonia phage Clark]QYC54539.1 hypothetical protein SEA_SAMMAN98_61 [Gordonia phage Samman98]